MIKLKVGSPPFNVGITMIDYRLFPGELERTIESFQTTENHRGFVLQIVQEEDGNFTSQAPDGRLFFNRNKGHNFGIKALRGEVKLIICADADVLIPPWKIDQTVEKWKEKKRPVWSLMVKGVQPEEIWPRRWEEWQNELKKCKTAKGPWNCATWEQWKKAGGWNENLFGRWVDRDLHKRFYKAKVGVTSVWENPIVHVSHPARFTVEESSYLKRTVKQFTTNAKWESFL